MHRDERFMRELVVKLKRLERVEGVPMVMPWRDEKLMCREYHEHADGMRCVEWTDKE